MRIVIPARRILATDFLQYQDHPVREHSHLLEVEARLVGISLSRRKEDTRLPF